MSDFQRAAGDQGREFERQCRYILDLHHFAVTPGRLRLEIGVEIDIDASIDGRRYWFECKGSFLGDRPGTLRTDTMKKALSSAFLLHVSRDVFDWPPFVLLTSHLPKPDSAGGRMLEQAQKAGVFHDVIRLYEPADMRRLAAFGGGT